jgi:putative sigma-54 modulation protein
LEGKVKIIYSGKTKDFTPQFEKKVEEKLGKMAKMIEQRGEKSAQVLHRQERHLHKVEIRTNFYDHALLGTGEDPDLMTALCDAMEKLEKQIVKLRNRWRDTHRDVKSQRAQKESAAESEAAEEPAASAQNKKSSKGNGNGIAVKPRVFRVAPDGDAKPMTLEEAILVMRGDLDYIVYRDLDRSSLSVLLRRSDGNFDLIEA